MEMIFREKVAKTKAFLTNCTLDEGGAVAFLHVTLLNSVGGEAELCRRLEWWRMRVYIFARVPRVLQKWSEPRSAKLVINQ